MSTLKRALLLTESKAAGDGGSGWQIISRHFEGIPKALDHDVLLVDLDGLFSAWFDVPKRLGDSKEFWLLFSALRRAIREMIAHERPVVVFPSFQFSTAFAMYLGSLVDRDRKIAGESGLPPDLVSQRSGKRVEAWDADNRLVQDFLGESEMEYRCSLNADAAHTLPLVKIASTELIVGWGDSRHKVLYMPRTRDEENHLNLARVAALLVRESFATKAATQETLPEWAKRMRSSDELGIGASLSALEQQAAQLAVSIDSTSVRLEEAQQWKRLFVSKGDPLEAVAREALSVLGFTVLPPTPKRADIRATFEGRTIVFEVKGREKGSGGDVDSRQLLRWMSDADLEFSVESKGVLVMNAFAEVPLVERTQPAFSDQMLEYVVRKGQCLLTGIQLYCLVLDCQRNPDITRDRILELLDTVGPYTRYSGDAWRDWLSEDSATGGEVASTAAGGARV